MKVKNLAFFGAMATILSVAGAYADPATLIASKNYVDTQTGTKQAKSTADYQMGNKDGSWTAMTEGQQSALNSGITSAKVTQYDTYETGKQNTITDQAKVSADLIDDSTSTNKFVTASDKSTWSGKQDALTFDTTPTANSTNPVTSGGVATALAAKANSSDIVAQVNADWNATSGKGEILNKPTTIFGYGITDAYTKTEVDTSLSGKQPTIDSTHKVSADNIDDTNTTNKFVTDTEKSTWSGKQDAITDQNQLAASKVSGLANVATSGAYSDLSGTPTLATVATSGSYTDLQDKPTIPTVDQEYSASSTNAQSGTAVAEALGTLDGGTITSTAGQPFTSISQANGQVSASTGTIKYAAAMDSELPNVDTPDSTTAQNCTENTCILTYKNGKYTWTPMQL